MQYSLTQRLCTYYFSDIQLSYCCTHYFAQNQWNRLNKLQDRKSQTTMGRTKLPTLL